jgi:hypothetical protein
VHYDDKDNSELEDRSNERISHVFGGEAKFVRQRYIQDDTPLVVKTGDELPAVG